MTALDHSALADILVFYLKKTVFVLLPNSGQKRYVLQIFTHHNCVMLSREPQITIPADM